MATTISVISIFVFIGFIYLIRFSFSNMGGFNYEKIRWLLAGYSAILILAVGIYYILPSDQFREQHTITLAEIERADEYYRNFHEAAQTGQLEHAEGVYRSGSWSFAYAGDVLEITNKSGHRADIWMLAERDANLNNEIKISSYITSTIMNGIDFTSEIKSPDIELKDNNLMIITPEPYKLFFANFKKDFVIAQFIETDNYSHRGGMGVFGHQVLHIKVPENVEINNGEYGIEFIKE